HEIAVVSRSPTHDEGLAVVDPRTMTHLPFWVNRIPKESPELRVELLLHNPVDVEPSTYSIVAPAVANEDTHDPIAVEASDVTALGADAVNGDPEVGTDNA